MVDIALNQHVRAIFQSDKYQNILVIITLIHRTKIIFENILLNISIRGIKIIAPKNVERGNYHTGGEQAYLSSYNS